MSMLGSSIHNIRLFDELSKRESVLHKIHPLVHILVTFVCLVSITSFNKYEFIRLLPFTIYPLFAFVLSGIPVKPLLKRLLIIEPLIIGIGILNPLFDKSLLRYGDINLPGGWAVFISIMIKSGIGIISSLLLIAVTGIDKLASGLRMIKVPKIIVLQILLTYRYITELLEETWRILRAYSIRAPKQKGIHHKHWGMLTGQLILRTYDRAQRVYEAMCLRGFNGEYRSGGNVKIRQGDILYLLIWVVFFIINRIYDVPEFIGMIITGVINI